MQNRSVMNVLISSCFILPTRYDGKCQNKPEVVEIIEYLTNNGVNLIPICPEQLGGLSTPRIPAEIIGNKVVDRSGVDVTSKFELGAKLTLETIKQLDIEFAILKEGSPSCGSLQIYDGSHQAIKISGQGITSRLLQENGITVYSEHQLQQIKEEIWKSRI